MGVVSKGGQWLERDESGFKGRQWFERGGEKIGGNFLRHLIRYLDLKKAY